MVRKPGGPRSTSLQLSMKRYQRSCATLRASRLLIDLSRIGMARGRALLEQQASKAEDRGNNLPTSAVRRAGRSRRNRWTYSVTNSSEGIRKGSSPLVASSASCASVA